MSAATDLVRAALDLFEREGPEAIVELADPEIEVQGEGDLIDTTVYRGREGFRTWSRQWLDAWQSFRMEPRELIEVADGIVVVPLHQVGVGKASGIEVETDVAYLIEVRDSRLTRLRLYTNEGRALEVARELAGACGS